MNKKIMIVMIAVAGVILVMMFLMSVRIAPCCGISLKENLTFKGTFPSSPCHDCSLKEEIRLLEERREELTRTNRTMEQELAERKMNQKLFEEDPAYLECKTRTESTEPKTNEVIFIFER